MSSTPMVVYGAEWCADCHRVRRILDDRGVAYEYKDIDGNKSYQEEMLQLTGGSQTIPTLQIGELVVSDPPNAELLRILKDNGVLL